MFASRAAEIAKDATDLVKWMSEAPPSEARDILRTAYTDSLRTVYIVMAAVAFVATLASLWAQHYDMNQSLQTEQ